MSQDLPAVPVTAVSVEPLEPPTPKAAKGARPVATDPRFAAALEPGVRIDKPAPGGTARAQDPAWKVAKEFEAMMLGQMFSSMFKGIKADGMFGGGNSEKTWRSFLFNEFGKVTSDSGGLGIAEALYADLKGKLGRAAAEANENGNQNPNRG